MGKGNRTFAGHGWFIYDLWEATILTSTLTDYDAVAELQAHRAAILRVPSHHSFACRHICIQSPISLSPVSPSFSCCLAARSARTLPWMSHGCVLNTLLSSGSEYDHLEVRFGSSKYY